MKDQIQEALKEGYSQKEIFDYIQKNKPDYFKKIQEAQTEGYSSEEIFNYLSGPSKTSKFKPFIETGKGLGRTVLKGGVSLAAAPSKSIGGFLTLLSKIGQKGRPGTKMIETAGKYFSKLGKENQEFLKGKIEQLLGKSFGSGEEAITKYVENIADIFGQAPMKTLAIPSAIAGLAGSTAELMGAPSLVKTAVEIGPFLSPKFSKILVPKANQKYLVNWAREMGLSENQITPLIQSEKKQAILSKVATKRGKTKKALEESQKGLSNIYNRLEKFPEANRSMSKNEIGLFTKEMGDILEKIPAGKRDLIAKDAADLVKTGFSGSGLMNFYHDINSYNEPVLGRLKEPIEKAVARFSPKLGEDFKMTNELYKKWAVAKTRLKPTIVSELWGASEVGRLLYGIISFNYPVLIEALGEHALKNLSREMLINPRFQNLSKQMTKALNENKLGIFNQLKNKLGDLVSETDKESGEKIKSFKY